MGEAIRPQVVQALVDAFLVATPEARAGAEAQTDATEAERWAAWDLFISTMLATREHRDRTAQVWDVLIRRQWDSRPSWAELFDDLEPSHVEQLRDLYDAMPEPARAEFDRRYGRPQL